MEVKSVKRYDAEGAEQRILVAAQTVFLRKGFISTSMSDIATEAGIGRTSLHYYFRTKDVLFEAMVKTFVKNIFPDIEKIVDGEGTFLDKLTRIVDRYLDVLKVNPFMPLFFITEINRDQDHFLKVFLSQEQPIAVLTKLRLQVEQEMQARVLRTIPIVDLISTVGSLMIFPFLLRRLIISQYLHENSTLFNQFIDRKKMQIIEVLTQLLSI